MKIAIASDHAAFEMKRQVRELVESLGHETEDFGTYSMESVDYPDFAIPAAQSVANKMNDLGIIICGTGIGMSIAANKVRGIRAALCCTEETAKLARQHNNANVICLPARYVSIELSRQMVDKFLSTDFEGGRHATRVGKIACS